MLASSNVEQLDSTNTIAATNANENNLMIIPKERLIIHKIVVTNFKSYSGTQTIGPFHQNFTSVVGPNGSGKSNVIDAIMFVLGYRAKKMRQSRLSDLIYQSPSSTSTPIDSCEVSVHFQRILSNNAISSENDDNFPQMIGDPLIIKRVANRNLKSHYTMNGKTCSFEDISSRLQEEGIDLNHRRFLILQGEVEAIAMMKPKGSSLKQGSTATATGGEEGLLEYLEDIIGTNVLIEPITKKGEELDLLIEEHAALAVRLKHAERECESLRPEKEKVEHFLNLENELFHLINKLTQIEISFFQRQKEELSHILLKDKEDFSSLGVESSKRMEKLSQEENSIKNLKIFIKQNETKLASMRKSLELSSSTIMKEKEMISFLLKKRESSESSLAECERSRRDVEGRCFTIKNDSEVYKKKLLERETEKELLSGDNSLLRQKIHSDPSLKDIRLQIESLEEGLLVMYEEEAKTGSSSKVKASKSKMIVIPKMGGKSLKDKENIFLEIKKKEEELKNLYSQHHAILEKISSKEMGNSSISKKREDLLMKLGMMEDTLEEAEALYQSNGGDGSKENSANHSSQVSLDFKKLPGVYGRMGDLCSIDARYDIAVSTAIGSSMDNILVQSTEDGQRAIEMLRERRLGRYNFTILDKMKSHHQSAGDQGTFNPDYCSLFSLLSLKDLKYSDAFHFATRNTLVCLSGKIGYAEDLAFGRIIKGGGRQRVVTLDGRMFETSGTISGGGRPRQGSVILNVDSKTRNVLDIAKTPTPTITLQQLKALQLESKATRQELQKMEQSLSKEEKVLLLLRDDEITITAKIEVIIIQIERLRQEERDMVIDVDAVLMDVSSPIMGGGEETSTKIKNQLLKLEKLRLEMRNSPNGFLLQRGEEKNSSLERDILELHLKVKESTQLNDELSSQLGAILLQIQVLEGELGKIAIDLESSKEKIKQAEAEMVSIMDIKSLEISLEDSYCSLRDAEGIMCILEEELVEDRRKISSLRLCIEEGEEKVSLLTSQIKDKEFLLSSLTLHPTIDSLNNDEHLSLPFFCPSDNDNTLYPLISSLKKEVHERKEYLSGLTPNLTIIEEWKKISAERSRRSHDLNEKETILSSLREEWDALREKRHSEFMSGFTEISRNVKRIYQRLMNGGNAELELVDSLDPFEEGIIFSIMPPRKSWKVISNLSGGEKTISSLSLVFALHLYRPTSCYVMDEIDAALDWRNVGIIAQYVREQRLGSQFIVISLRNDMFEMADRLVGIYKGWKEQKTMTVSLDPRIYQ